VNMSQQKLWHDDIYDALRGAVEALGGTKRVGHALWPAKTIEEAGKHLDRCLLSTSAQKLSLEELMWIFTQSAAKGCHVIADHFGQAAGYRFVPVEPKDEAAELQRQFIRSVDEQKALLERLQRVQLRAAS
jgi:hypothetical protein